MISLNNLAARTASRLFSRSARRCTALEFAALVYLALPLAIFWGAFTNYFLAVPGVFVILILAYRVLPQRPFRVDLTSRELATCVVVSAVFLWCCGYLPPVGRSWDWMKHFAIVNELGQNPWPPIQVESGTFLRYYLGYYILPGLATKVFGNSQIELFVFAQTWIGLFLLLALLLEKIRPRRPIAFIALFLLFSGLDLIGTILFDKNWSILSHKEWWAGFPGILVPGKRDIVPLGAAACAGGSPRPAHRAARRRSSHAAASVRTFACRSDVLVTVRGRWSAAIRSQGDWSFSPRSPVRLGQHSRRSGDRPASRRIPARRHRRRAARFQLE